MSLGVHCVHTIKFTGKQCGFLSARTCADFYDYVLVVIRVTWKEKNLKFLGKSLHILFSGPVILLGKLGEFRIKSARVYKFLGFGKSFLRLLILTELIDNRSYLF